MPEIDRSTLAGMVELTSVPLDSADARWCLAQYFSEIAARFDGGFDPGVGSSEIPSPARLAEDVFLLATLDSEPVGCGMLKPLTVGIGEIKRVWTSPKVRGLGLATRLMDRLEQIAGEAGFDRVRLDTNKALTEAHALYRKRGYVEIQRYNNNPYAHHWFEKVLGQPKTELL